MGYHEDIVRLRRDACPWEPGQEFDIDDVWRALGDEFPSRWKFDPKGGPTHPQRRSCGQGMANLTTEDGDGNPAPRIDPTGGRRYPHAHGALRRAARPGFYTIGQPIPDMSALDWCPPDAGGYKRRVVDYAKPVRGKKVPRPPKDEALHQRIHLLQAGVCWICGDVIGRWIHADLCHVLAFSRGGSEDAANRLSGHPKCNDVMGADKTLDETRAVLIARGWMDPERAQFADLAIEAVNTALKAQG